MIVIKGYSGRSEVQPILKESPEGGSLPQKDNAEHERYAGANSRRKTEDNVTNANKPKEKLLEKIL